MRKTVLVGALIAALSLAWANSCHDAAIARHQQWRDEDRGLDSSIVQLHAALQRNAIRYRALQNVIPQHLRQNRADSAAAAAALIQADTGAAVLEAQLPNTLRPAFVQLRADFHTVITRQAAQISRLSDDVVSLRGALDQAQHLLEETQGQLSTAVAQRDRWRKEAERSEGRWSIGISIGPGIHADSTARLAFSKWEVNVGVNYRVSFLPRFPSIF